MFLFWQSVEFLVLAPEVEVEADEAKVVQFCGWVGNDEVVGVELLLVLNGHPVGKALSLSGFPQTQ